MTIFWIWDSRSGGNLRVVTFCLHMLRVTPLADTINGITKILSVATVAGFKSQLLIFALLFCNCGL